MKLVEPQIQSSPVQCPRCKAAMQLVCHNSCQHIETVKEERAAQYGHFRNAPLFASETSRSAAQ